MGGVDILGTPWFPDEEGNLGGHLSESWLQGRAIFGGVITAVLATAMQRHAPGRPARTISVQFCAPGRPGPARALVEPVREGRYLSQAGAHLEQEGRIVARAFASFGCDRDYPVSYSADRMPEVAAAQTVPAMPPSPLMPVFTQQVEFRFALGAPPKAGASRPELGGWCRFREQMPADLGMFCGLLDIWPPPAFSMLKDFGPGATIDLTHHFLVPLPLANTTEDALYLYSGRAPTIAGGYQEAAGELWTGDGRLIARTRQMAALF